MTITREMKITALKRELHMRRRVYPHRDLQAGAVFAEDEGMKKSCAKCAYDMGPSWDDCAALCIKRTKTARA